MLYFPGTQIDQVKTFYKFEGERSLEGLEKFSVKEGYLNSSKFNYDEIPKKVEGFRLLWKYIRLVIRSINRETDYFFEYWGLEEVVP